MIMFGETVEHFQKLWNLWYLTYMGIQCCGCLSTFTYGHCLYSLMGKVVHIMLKIL